MLSIFSTILPSINDTSSVFYQICSYCAVQYWVDYQDKRTIDLYASAIYPHHLLVFFVTFHLLIAKGIPAWRAMVTERHLMKKKMVIKSNEDSESMCLEKNHNSLNGVIERRMEELDVREKQVCESNEASSPSSESDASEEPRRFSPCSPIHSDLTLTSSLHQQSFHSSPSSTCSTSWYDIRSLMFYYNTLMIAVNGFFFFWFAAHIDLGRKFVNFRYPSFDDVSPQTMYEIQLVSIYFWTKPLDLLDTVFFALRGKSSHLSFLHLYHHTLVPILGWLALRLNPCVPFIYLFGLINSFVHTVMYAYYALASMGVEHPTLRKFLWWKKYITQLQIGQFIVYGVYVAALMVFQQNYPSEWLYLCGVQPMVFGHMFYQFYQKTYSISRENIGGKGGNKDQEGSTSATLLRVK